MQHATVVARLMLADSPFFLEHNDSGIRKSLAQPETCSETYNASPDDNDALGLQFTVLLDRPKAENDGVITRNLFIMQFGRFKDPLLCG